MSEMSHEELIRKASQMIAGNDPKKAELEKLLAAHAQSVLAIRKAVGENDQTQIRMAFGVTDK